MPMIHELAAMGRKSCRDLRTGDKYVTEYTVPAYREVKDEVIQFLRWTGAERSVRDWDGNYIARDAIVRNLTTGVVRAHRFGMHCSVKVAK